MPLASVSGPVRELKGVKAVREKSHFLLYQHTCLTHLPFVPLLELTSVFFVGGGGC